MKLRNLFNKYSSTLIGVLCFTVVWASKKISLQFQESDLLIDFVRAWFYGILLATIFFSPTIKSQATKIYEGKKIIFSYFEVVLFITTLVILFPLEKSYLLLLYSILYVLKTIVVELSIIQEKKNETIFYELFFVVIFLLIATSVVKSQEYLALMVMVLGILLFSIFALSKFKLFKSSIEPSPNSIIFIVIAAHVPFVNVLAGFLLSSPNYLIFTDLYLNVSFAIAGTSFVTNRLLFSREFSSDLVTKNLNLRSNYGKGFILFVILSSLFLYFINNPIFLLLIYFLIRIIFTISNTSIWTNKDIEYFKSIFILPCVALWISIFLTLNYLGDNSLAPFYSVLTAQIITLLLLIALNKKSFIN